MAPAIASITPNRGSPVGYAQASDGTRSGGQIVTISGSGFGETAGTVTIETRPAPVLTWVDDLIAALVPPRCSSGAWDYSGGSVDVVVTDADGEAATAAAAFTYLATRNGLALANIKSRLGGYTQQGGHFFDWSPAQILPVRLDLETPDNGTPWPHAILYSVSGENDKTAGSAGFRVFEYSGELRLIKKIASSEDINMEQDMMMADGYAAVMGDLSCGGITNTIQVVRMEVGHAVYKGVGTCAVALVGFTYSIQTIENDTTQNSTWASTRS